MRKKFDRKDFERPKSGGGKVPSTVEKRLAEKQEAKRKKKEEGMTEEEKEKLD